MNNNLDEKGNMHNSHFSMALMYLKSGGRVARDGWNGKNMWLILVNPGNYTIDVAPHPSLLGIILLPWIGMKTADGKFVPWLASQTDILAEDWILYSA